MKSGAFLAGADSVVFTRLSECLVQAVFDSIRLILPNFS